MNNFFKNSFVIEYHKLFGDCQPIIGLFVITLSERRYLLHCEKLIIIINIIAMLSTDQDQLFWCDTTYYLTL